MIQKRIPSTKGNLLVQTSKEMYLISETIQGNIFVNINEEGYQAGILTLRFVGQELSQKTIRSQQNNEVQRQVHKDKFLDVSTELKNYGEKLPISQEVYPFQIGLNICSSTLSAKFSSEDYANIYFYIIVQFKQADGKKCNETIKFKLPITIAQPYIPINRPVLNKARHEVQFCFCCKSGSILLTTQMNKSDYMTEQIMNVQLRADLTLSPKTIINMQVLLVGVLSIKNGKELRTETFIYHQQKIEGVQCWSLKKYEFEVPITSKHDSRSIFLIQTSSQTKNIKYQHYLKIIPELEGCNCNDNWEVDVPINIIRPPQSTFDILKLDARIYQAPQEMAALPKWDPVIQNCAQMFVNQDPIERQSYYYESPDKNKISQKQIATQSACLSYNQYHAYNQNYLPINVEMINPQGKTISEYQGSKHPATSANTNMETSLQQQIS
ncbi:hypothetical protein pb186bvf_009646 [Paramecium bursaria]